MQAGVGSCNCRLKLREELPRGYLFLLGLLGICIAFEPLGGLRFKTIDVDRQTVGWSWLRQVSCLGSGPFQINMGICVSGATTRVPQLSLAFTGAHDVRDTINWLNMEARSCDRRNLNSHDRGKG